MRLDYQPDTVRISVDSQPAQCAHDRLALRELGQIVECMDCGRQVSAWWALATMAERYAAALKAQPKEDRTASSPQSPPERPTLHFPPHSPAR